MEQKSTFVTVLAWIFIVLSGFGLLILAMDAAVFWMFPFEKLMAQNAALHPNQPQLPAALMAALFRWGMVVMLLLQAWVLASAIGLLLRKNWGRISFIVIMVIGLVFNGLYLLVELMAVIGIHFIGKMAAPPGMPPEFQSFMQVFMIMFMVLTIAMLVLFGWIVKKLVSEDIRKEFEKPADKPGAFAA